jgi:hypothetical protein
MTHHEAPITQSAQEHSAESEVATQGYEHAKAPVPVYDYDPVTLRELTAADMDAIDEQAWALMDSGATVEEAQAMVYETLTQKGFDLTEARDNRLVIRFSNGEDTDTRVINLSCQNFGETVRNAELAERVVEEVPLEMDAEESSNDTEDSERQRNARVASEMIAEMASNVHMLEAPLSKLPSRNEAQRQQEARFQNYLTNLRAELHRRPLSPEELHELSRQAAITAQAFESQTAHQNEVQRTARTLIADFEDVRRVAIKADEAGETAVIGAKRGGSATEEVAMHAGHLRNVTHSLHDSLRALRVRAEEAAENRYGHDVTHKAALLQQIEVIINQMPSKMALDAKTAYAVEDLRATYDSLQ